MEELKKAIAYIFRKKGAQRIRESALRDMVTFDLRWFSPEDAQKFIEIGKAQGLLELRDGHFFPLFETAAVQLPVSYAPDARMLTQAPETRQAPAQAQESVFPSLVRAVEKASGLPREQLMSRINAAQGLLGVDIEVAALVVGLDYGVDPKAFVPQAEAEIIERYRDAAGG